MKVSQPFPNHDLGQAAFIALGANLPIAGLSPAQAVSLAVSALSCTFGGPVTASRLYATPCMPAGAGPDYVNAVVALSQAPGPAETLALLHGLEARFDRARQGRWAARTLDLDLLDHGGQVLPDAAVWAHWADLPPDRQRIEAPDRLILPHPRLAERAFVLVPLAEIAPAWRHPLLGQTAAELRDALPAADLAAIRPLPVADLLAFPAQAR